MKTSEAARYARWAAIAAILLTVIVAGVYLRRNLQAREVRKSAPPPVPSTVQQRSAEFSFSKVEKDRTIFTVRASRATAFKQGSKNLLEDVWITIYGRSGLRLDNIHTQSCDYLSDRGEVICAGKVTIDLQSAADAKRYGSNPADPAAAAHMEHIETSNLSFDRDSGIASTDRGVDFRFPDGEGVATGTRYDSRENILRLLQNVELKVRPRAHAARDLNNSAPIILTGGSLEYQHNARLIRLLAPVHAQQGVRELRASELAIELNADYHVQRVVARPEGTGQQVELRSSEKGLTVLNADEFTVQVHPEGWVERAQASGAVRASATNDAGEDRLTAAKLELQFVPHENQPEQMTASGGVTSFSNRRGRLQRLDTPALRMTFAPTGPKSRRELSHAETLGAGTLELQAPGAAGQPPREFTKITGQQLSADFAEKGRLRSVAAKNGMSVERRVPDRPVEFSSAREAAVRFDDDGEWTEVTQNGSVRFRQGVNAAQGEHAKLDRASDTMTLTGAAEMSDGTIRVTGQSATFNSVTADFRVDGAVRTTYLKSDGGSVANFSPQPAFIIADHLQGNSSGGRAFYSGRARLWQGDSVIEGDSIELLRDARRLAAKGNVSAAFIQAAGSSAVPQIATASTKTSRPDLWRVHAGSLTYSSGEARALLDGSITAESSQAGIVAKTLELFFSPANASAAASVGAAPGKAPSPAGPPGLGGALQLSRLVATGGVTVKQADRRGTAERAVFTAAEQKFVLSGGNPTIYDGSRGSTTGRELTFFFANDTIIVDSEEGTRTLTKHRVEK
jgi:lipopolysaccharide export system protein LptA